MTIKKTTELPTIIPPLPEGDRSFLKTWQDYWEKHDARVRAEERDWWIKRIECILQKTKFYDELECELFALVLEAKEMWGERK